MIAREVSSLLAERTEALCRDLLPEGRREGAEWRCGSVQGEPGKSLGVHLTGTKAGIWSDFATDQSGDALDLVKAALNLDTPSAIQWAKDWLGIRDDDHSRTSRRREVSTREPAPAKPNPDIERNTAFARRVWAESRPAAGSLAETYLQFRGLTLAPPPSLRFNPSVRYPHSGLALPCMIAAVQAPDWQITGIHRTFLRADGRGKAGVRVDKMSLGPIGNGAVRLAKAGPVLGLSEGIESGMSAMQLFDLPVWAALGSRLDRVALPAEVIELQLFADSGQAGRDAAEKAAEHFTKDGRRVTLRFPPDGCGDWNDTLVAANQGMAE